MIIFRRFLLAVAFLFCATSGAWAQTGTKALSSGTTLSPFTFGNDTFTVSGCTTNFANSVGCSSLDVVATIFRGVVTLTVQNHTSDSSIVDGNFLANYFIPTVALTITVGNISGKTYQTISKVGTTTTGSIGTGHSASGAFIFSNNNFTGNYQTNDLLDTLTVGGTSASASTTSGTQPTTGWSVTETFSLASASADLTNNILKGSISFYKAPEPASIALLAVGLGGLAVARRRLRRRASAGTEGKPPPDQPGK